MYIQACKKPWAKQIAGVDLLTKSPIIGVSVLIVIGGTSLAQTAKT